MSDETIAAIERAQKRLQKARGHVRDIIRRQEERLEQSRRILDWVSK